MVPHAVSTSHNTQVIAILAMSLNPVGVTNSCPSKGNAPVKILCFNYHPQDPGPRHSKDNDSFSQGSSQLEIVAPTTNMDMVM